MYDPYSRLLRQNILECTVSKMYGTYIFNNMHAEDI